MRGKPDQWAAAVRDVHDCGWLSEPYEVARGVWAAQPTAHGWRAAAYELAARLPGQVWPGRRSVSWVCGANGPHGRLLDPGDVPAIREAQDTLADLGLRDEMPWSLGRIARALLTWAVPPERCPANTDHLLEGIEVGYHDCRPGEYPQAQMWDVHSYYYTLLERAPSPRVQVGRSGSVHWGALTTEERARWRQMLAVVDRQKVLRNSLVGTAMGAKGKRVVFVRDKERPGRALRVPVSLPGGPYRGLGLLIVRTGYELCHAAACETDSIYSTIDSVCFVGQSTRGPKAWESLGFECAVKAGGAADIRRRGCWRVGHAQTVPYAREYRMPVGVPRPGPPPFLVWKEWL